MIQQLENAISKLSELSETEQEAIAQMIMKTIESNKEEKSSYVEDDPLAELRNSDFIGCFSGEPDLAEKSEPNYSNKNSNKKAKPPSRLGSGKSILRHAGKWVGDDLEECLDMVYSSRGEAEF